MLYLFSICFRTACRFLGLDEKSTLETKDSCAHIITSLYSFREYGLQIWSNLMLLTCAEDKRVDPCPLCVWRTSLLHKDVSGNTIHWISHEKILGWWKSYWKTQLHWKIQYCCVHFQGSWESPHDQQNGNVPSQKNFQQERWLDQTVHKLDWWELSNFFAW